MSLPRLPAEPHDVYALADAYQAMTKQISKVIVGQKEVIEQLIARAFFVSEDGDHAALGENRYQGLSVDAACAAWPLRFCACLALAHASYSLSHCLVLSIH